jgi:hypothetical protein
MKALCLISPLLAIGCWLVAVLHIAVLRDRSIHEPHAFESMRKIRIGGWIVAGLVAWHSPGFWVLPVLALALCDAISAVGRLWPVHHNDGDSFTSQGAR